MQKLQFRTWGKTALSVLALAVILAGCPASNEENDNQGLKLPDGTTPDINGEPGDNIVLKSLSWIGKNAAENGEYTIFVDQDITATLAESATGTVDDGSDGSANRPGWFRMVPKIEEGDSGYDYWSGEGSDHYNFYPESTVNGVKKITITLKSNSSTPRTIKLDPASKGTLIELGAGKKFKGYLKDHAEEMEFKLILENIILQGHDDNVAQLVYVGSGGVLEIKNGAAITGNRHAESAPQKSLQGGGILVARDGKVILDGGSIENNTLENLGDNGEAWGGGIAITDNRGATFIMKSGNLTRNKVIAKAWGTGGGLGAMVAYFSIEGGTISENVVQTTSGAAAGAAIGRNFYWASANISGGTIKDNDAVCLNSAGHVYPGVRLGSVSDNYGGTDSITISGNPDIPDGLCITASTSAVKIGGTMTNANPIPIDFVSTAMEPDPDNASAYLNRPAAGQPLLVWAEGQSGTLPVDRFTLGKYRKNDGESEPVSGRIASDGTYQP
ncbi:MAG: hypothetical protein LBG87_01775 [Spirochaetaceae bacterium]|jgi:hypothetical protein|nr:hypothetical protein [Spirochaetaceae bacterium]